MTPNIVKGSNSLPADRYDNPKHPANNPDFHPAGYTPNKDRDQEQSNMSSGMDGDHSAKAMDKGANAATNVSDLTEGVHEDIKQTTIGAGAKTTGQGTSMFSKDGAIGGAFTKEGAIGSVGQKVGGPLAADGMIGKNFNPDGAVGGTFQKLAEKNEQH